MCARLILEAEALDARVRRALLGVTVLLAVAFVSWTGYVWTQTHFAADNGYERAAAYVKEIPEEYSVGVTNDTTQFVMGDLLVSRKVYGSVEELQADRVDYVVISSKLVEQGYGPSPELYRWVKNHGKLVYGFVGRSFGLMGVYWIPEQVDQKGPTAARLSEAEYVDRVGEIQSSSVSDLLEIEQKIRRYDALTAADVKEIGANRASLKGFTDEVDGLDSPQKYRAQYEVFRSAIREMYQASTVAYSLAADPISATQADFDAYQGHVDKAAAHLRSSNEMLGRHYRTVEAPRESGL